MIRHTITLALLSFAITAFAQSNESLPFSIPDFEVKHSSVLNEETIGSIIKCSTWNRATQQWVTRDSSWMGFSCDEMKYGWDTHLWWESGSWRGSRRFEATFDEDSLITYELLQDWENGGWVNRYRFDSFEYNDAGFLKSRIQQLWNGVEWENHERYLYSYDDAGNTVEAITQVWQDDNWINEERRVSEYNTRNQETSQQTFFWTNNEWLTISIIQSTYDETSGKLTSYTILDRVGEALENQYRRLYEYDSAFRQTASIVQIWDGTNWENSSETFDEYNSEGQRTSSTTRLWIDTSWLNVDRQLYFYDELGNMEKQISQSWNGEWINSSQSLNEYNAEGLINLSTTQLWQDSIWINNFRTFREYDDDNRWIEELEQFWENGEWINLVQCSQTFLTCPVTTSTTEIQHQQLFTVYPNPSSGTVQLSLKEELAREAVLTVFDTNGKVMWQKNGLRQNTLELNNLPSGVYIVQIVTEKRVASEKIVIRR